MLGFVYLDQLGLTEIDWGWLMLVYNEKGW